MPSLALVLALSSCASPLADYSGYVAPRPYGIDCGAGLPYAATALKSNGFAIAEVRRETAGGVVVGKRDGETMTIAVSCEGDGVHVTPSGLTPYARNGMIIAFERVMETASAVQPPRGIEVSVELIAGVETALYFSRELDASSGAAARFRIANGGTRPLNLLTERIQLRTVSGKAASALSSGEIQRRLPQVAAEILPRLLRSGILKTGDRAEGFLLFPADQYDGALVPLVDVETGEAEEFETTFPSAG